MLPEEAREMDADEKLHTSQGRSPGRSPGRPQERSGDA